MFDSLVSPKYQLHAIVAGCVVIALIAFFAYRSYCGAASSGGSGKKSDPASGDQRSFSGPSKASAPSNSNDPAMILIHAEWCGHCKHFMPTWDGLVEQQNGKVGNVRLLKIDGSEHPEVTQAFGVDGFPTLVYAPQGVNHPESAVKYAGDRSPDAIIAFINEQ